MKKYFATQLPAFFLACSCLTAPLVSQAYELSFAPPKTPYLGIESAYNTIKSGQAEYNPLSAKLRIGMFFYTNIALELSYSGGLKSDTTESGSEIDLKSAAGLFLRIQSPIQQGMRVYVYGGYNTLTVSETPVSGNALEESYDAVAWGAGLEEHFEKWSNLVFFGEYGRPYDDEFRISHYSLGARYQY